MGSETLHWVGCGECRFAFHDDEIIPNPDAMFFSKFDYQKYKKVGKGEILPTRGI